jgi:hypothetical protein
MNQAPFYHGSIESFVYEAPMNGIKRNKNRGALTLIGLR